jgi:hypothetical protein
VGIDVQKVKIWFGATDSPLTKTAAGGADMHAQPRCGAWRHQAWSVLWAVSRMFRLYVLFVHPLLMYIDLSLGLLRGSANIMLKTDETGVIYKLGDLGNTLYTAAARIDFDPGDQRYIARELLAGVSQVRVGEHPVVSGCSVDQSVF